MDRETGMEPIMDVGRLQSQFDFLCQLTYRRILIQENTDTHSLSNKGTRKQSEVQRQASRGGGKEATNMVTHGLENQTLSHIEEL